mmetsp:Transcript_88/g.281  ORF Transcript_88/g.281 Transcript_88/m.281 type:complete len:90 (-) Transcript_88:620-889(-)
MVLGGPKIMGVWWKVLYSQRHSVSATRPAKMVPSVTSEGKFSTQVRKLECLIVGIKPILKEFEKFTACFIVGLQNISVAKQPACRRLFS